MGQLRARPPKTPERRESVENHDRLLDRVDGATEAPVGLRDLGVTGTTRDANDAVLRTPTAGPHLEARRLGHHTRVRGKPTRDQRSPASSRGLLVGVRGHQRDRRREPTPSDDSTSTANTIAAIPPFMSHAPRPYRSPSRTTPTNGSEAHSETGAADTTSMWPLNTSDRPPPRPATEAMSCGRPAKSSPGGTSGFPAMAEASGSHKSTEAPQPANRPARYSCIKASSRAGSPTARAVVSNPIRSLASRTRSSRPAATASQTLCSASVKGMSAR